MYFAATVPPVLVSARAYVAGYYFPGHDAEHSIVTGLGVGQRTLARL